MVLARSTLARSAHRALRQAYARSLFFSFVLAVALHSLLLRAPLPEPVPRVLEPEPPFEDGAARVVDIQEYRPAPVRPVVFEDGDVPAEPAEIATPVFAPAPDPEWAGAMVLAPPASPRAPLSLSAVTSPPEVLEMVTAVYPELARMAEAEGTVLVGVTVDAEGAVSDTWIVWSDTIESLETAALEAVRRWRFRPARQGRHAVAVTLQIPIRFSLR